MCAAKFSLAADGCNLNSVAGERLRGRGGSRSRGPSHECVSPLFLW
jgi:hypothetical protein